VAAAAVPSRCRQLESIPEDPSLLGLPIKRAPRRG
jgi:hypothetical protein